MDESTIPALKLIVIYIYIYMCVCVCVLCIYIYMCVCVCVFCIYIYMCVCVCVLFQFIIHIRIKIVVSHIKMLNLCWYMVFKGGIWDLILGSSTNFAQTLNLKIPSSAVHRSFSMRTFTLPSMPSSNVETANIMRRKVRPNNG